MLLEISNNFRFLGQFCVVGQGEIVNEKQVSTLENDESNHLQSFPDNMTPENMTFGYRQFVQ